jgi:predicted house-cleaning noncanonical NTP pyrophosphatase (MazG superfamily)
MKKLIRDYIPEIALKEGRVLDTYIEQDNLAYFELLKAKLIEESNEVINSDRSTIVEELADVLTVIRAMSEYMLCEEELFQVAENKYKEKGGFSKRIVLTK